MSQRGLREVWETAMFGLPRPQNWGNVAASCTPDATVVETQTFVMTQNLTVNAPLGPRVIGDKLYLVFIDSNGGHTIAFASGAGGFRNAPTPSAGTAGQRLSAEFRFDGVSWQCTGSSSSFA